MGGLTSAKRLQKHFVWENLVGFSIGEEVGERARRGRPPLGRALAQSVFKLALQKSIPTRIRQLILYISNSKGSVDEFERDSTSAKRPLKHFV